MVGLDLVVLLTVQESVDAGDSTFLDWASLPENGTDPKMRRPNPGHT